MSAKTLWYMFLCFKRSTKYESRFDQALQICDNWESIPSIRRYENISARHIPSKKPSRSRSGFITKWRGILQGMPQVSYISFLHSCTVNPHKAETLFTWTHFCSHVSPISEPEWDKIATTDSAFPWGVQKNILKIHLATCCSSIILNNSRINCILVLCNGFWLRSHHHTPRKLLTVHHSQTRQQM